MTQDSRKVFGNDDDSLDTIRKRVKRDEWRWYGTSIILMIWGFCAGFMTGKIINLTPAWNLIKECIK